MHQLSHDILQNPCRHSFQLAFRSANRARERNRIAQRRYRDRQKTKLQESEDRVAELTDRLAKLASEKVLRQTQAVAPDRDGFTILQSVA